MKPNEVKCYYPTTQRLFEMHALAFPFATAFAKTFYKFQGITLRKEDMLLVFVEESVGAGKRKHRITQKELYVAMSRVRSVDQLLLSAKISEDKNGDVTSKQLAVMVTMYEEVRSKMVLEK